MGVKPQEIMAVGDSENDLEFLEVAGVKVAVANADQELKSLADYVSQKPYGDGVKEAIERFIP
jgi:hydroxymethylpyrimidine pyrophosphatase-like HAD family hydrolase